MSKKELLSGIAFLIVLGAVMFALVVLAFSHSGAIVKPPLFPTVGREDLHRAHLYHGINYSFQAENGEWVFERDGQECRLFSYLKKRR